MRGGLEGSRAAFSRGASSIRLVGLLGLLLGGSLLACDDGGGGDPVVDAAVSADGGADAGADATPPDAAVAATLTPSPDRFQVASVAPGDLNEAAVELTNPGPGTVHIDRVAFAGSPGIQILWRFARSMRAFVGIDVDGDDKFVYPIAIEAGQTFVLIVEYRPREVGTPSGNVVVEYAGNELVLPIEAIAAEGQIRVDPEVIQFGRVLPGSAGEVQVTVRNVGPGVLNLASAEVEGATFGVSLDNGRPLSAEVLADPDADGTAGLSPEAEFTFVATYTPEAEGGDEGVLNLRSDDPENPRLAVPLRGNIDDACIRADPPVLVWGGTVGVDAMAVVNIERCSPAPLEITSVQLRAGTSSTFTLLPEPPTTPATLDDDTPWPITVHFVPDDVREFTGTLEVQSSDLARPTLRIPLTGTGEQ